MAEPNKYRAYFTVFGEFDPEDVTRDLGLQPTRSWRRGDVNGETGLERNHTRWSLESRLQDSEPLEFHVDDVLQQLQSAAGTVRKFAAEYNGTLQLVAYFYTAYPGLYMDIEQVKSLADLGLSFDCDFYYLYSDKREDSN
jgi:hypothetical protein